MSAIGQSIERVKSLFASFNKASDSSGDLVEGILGEAQEELELKMGDEELLQLKNGWQKAYEAYSSPIVEKQEKNLRHWLGKKDDPNQPPISDNIIFEALETLLPILARQNPVPVVMSDNTEEGRVLAESVQKMLIQVADRQKLKIKVKQATRNWSLFYLGALKVGWDYVENDIRYSVIRPQKLILDPLATFDGGEYRGRYIGELRSDTADNLICRFPKKKDEILALVGDGKTGTDIGYVEWWTPEFVFWTLNELVLDKRKNPHWNYDGEEERTDRFGATVMAPIRGRNHFKSPRIPYSFLSVYNIGRQPHDDTCIVEQAIRLQDGVDKRAAQVDRNADDMNSGWVISSDFDKDAGNNLANALRKGGVIRAPTPNIDASVKRFQAAPLPSFIVEDLYDKRNEIRNIMGVRGSTAEGIVSERTVGGKIEIKAQDVDRATGITDFIEQFVDHVFNLTVQFMHVYYDEPHIASVVGKEKAVEVVRLQASDIDRELTVSVKEGSFIPQDPLLRRNEAIELWNAGALDPVSLMERLDDPTPVETAKKVWQWKAQPEALFGIAPAMPPEAAPPALPPEMLQLP